MKRFLAKLKIALIGTMIVVVTFAVLGFLFWLDKVRFVF